MEKLHYADTSLRVEVVIMAKLQGTWVLTVAKAVLDVALSIAASVILSLLLLSGDVEENPGPVGGIITAVTLICLTIQHIDNIIIYHNVMHNVNVYS